MEISDIQKVCREVHAFSSEIVRYIGSQVTPVRKTELHPRLKAADNALNEFARVLYEKHPPCNSTPLYAHTSDERLEMARQKELLAKDDPQVVIAQTVSAMAQALESFLSVYNIGYLNDVTMRDGVLEVTISCGVRKSTVNGHLPSEAAKYEQQVSLLEAMGLELSPHSLRKGDANIVSSVRNREILTDLLKKRGASMLTFSVTEEAVMDISFFVKTGNVHLFRTESPESEPEQDESILGADGTAIVKKYANELSSTLASMAASTSLHAVCGHLALAYFANICEALDFHGAVYTQQRALHKDERERNMAIREIEARTAALLPESSVSLVASSMEMKLRAFAASKLSSTLSDFTIDRYGNINATFRYTTREYYGAGALLSEHGMREKFETIGTSRKLDNLFILDTEANKKTYARIISESIPSAVYRATSSKYDRGYFLLDSFSVSIHNAADVAKLPEPPED